MIGIVEDVLTECYGHPRIVRGTRLLEYRWNEHSEASTCLLYKAIFPGSASDGGELGGIGEIYGDVMGGFLLSDSLKLAMVAGPAVYGLYALDELRMQPEIKDANRLAPDVEFFMDAANVWFYGAKEGELYVYDSETSELTRLGPLGQAIRGLLQQWEQAAPT